MRSKVPPVRMVALASLGGMALGVICFWVWSRGAGASEHERLAARVVERAAVAPDLTIEQIRAEHKEIIAAAAHALASSDEPIASAGELAAAFERTLAAYRSRSPAQLLELYADLGLTLESDRQRRLERTWALSSSMISGRKVDSSRVRGSTIARPGSGAKPPTEPGVFRRWTQLRGSNDVDLAKTAPRVVELSIYVTRQQNGDGGPYWFGIGFARRPTDGKWIPVSLSLNEVQDRPVMMPSM